uniref:non-specific serine/threonine protein kinase n=1 Tax=Ananas comosus var. bracteatus TaxID=296719 RepID=A0A6V7NHC7_ANACO|nr:unnamed protein product [Ananas comosus var. bracteatus]
MSPQLSLVVGLLVSSAVFGFCSAENILYTNDVLFGGQSLTNGNFRFTMQTDCNLVLYDGGSAIWSSGTYRKGTGCYVKMQSDGNLVVYNGSNNALWASNTDRGGATTFAFSSATATSSSTAPRSGPPGLTASEPPGSSYLRTPPALPRPRNRTLLRKSPW